MASLTGVVKHRITDQEKQSITSMRKKGISYNAIAKELGISLETIKTYCRRNNLTGRKQGMSTAGIKNTIGTVKRVGCHKKDPCRLTVSFAEESKGILAEVFDLLMQASIGK